MAEATIIVITVLTAIILSSFNLLTLFVMFMTPKLRSRVSNLPVLSFLIGSALQGVLPAPLYVYKVLQHQSGAEPGWLCDLYRFLYILCVHIMEISIMLLGFDRLIAVKYPFQYPIMITRKKSLAIIAVAWLVTVAVDVLPFFNKKKMHDKCSYVPEPAWGLCVILFYNMLPFITVVVNYAIIWKVAYNFAIEERARSESLRFNQKTELLPPTSNKGKGKSRAGTGQKGLCRFTLEIKATKTSLAIVAVYMVCWLPMGSFYMADHFCYNCISSNENLSDARRAVKLLAFSSSLLAPLIYCWWNKDFRNAARTVFRQSNGETDRTSLLLIKTSS